MNEDARRNQGTDTGRSAQGTVGQCEGQSSSDNGRGHGGSARVVQHSPEPWAVGETVRGSVYLDAPNGDPTIGYTQWTEFVRCAADLENARAALAKAKEGQP